MACRHRRGLVNVWSDIDAVLDAAQSGNRPALDVTGGMPPVLAYEVEGRAAIVAGLALAGRHAEAAAQRVLARRDLHELVACLGLDSDRSDSTNNGRHLAVCR